MLLRKLVAALCPLLLCMRAVPFVPLAGRRSGLRGCSGSFLLKGLLLGVALALIIPLAGLRCHCQGPAALALRGRRPAGRDPGLPVSGNHRRRFIPALLLIPLYPERSGHSGRRGRRRIYDRHRPAFQVSTPLKRIKSPLSSKQNSTRKRVFSHFLSGKSTRAIAIRATFPLQAMLPGRPAAQAEVLGLNPYNENSPPERRAISANHYFPPQGNLPDLRATRPSAERRPWG